MLAIPYYRIDGHGQWTVVSIRFRCIEDHEHSGHSRYNTMSGDSARLFNTAEILWNDDWICLTEGETDTIAAHLCGVPSVGVPGANAWQPHFKEAFVGYQTVWVLADGDTAGKAFGDSITKNLSNARVLQMPDGMDVDIVRQIEGAEALRQRIAA